MWCIPAQYLNQLYSDKSTCDTCSYSTGNHSWWVVMCLWIVSSRQLVMEWQTVYLLVKGDLEILKAVFEPNISFMNSTRWQWREKTAFHRKKPRAEPDQIVGHQPRFKVFHVSCTATWRWLDLHQSVRSSCLWVLFQLQESLTLNKYVVKEHCGRVRHI